MGHRGRPSTSRRRFQQQEQISTQSRGVCIPIAVYLPTRTGGMSVFGRAPALERLIVDHHVRACLDALSSELRPDNVQEVNDARANVYVRSSLTPSCRKVARANALDAHLVLHLAELLNRAKPPRQCRRQDQRGPLTTRQYSTHFEASPRELPFGQIQQVQTRAGIVHSSHRHRLCPQPQLQRGVHAQLLHMPADGCEVTPREDAMHMQKGPVIFQ